jgi:predicted Zn-dependent protease
VFWNPQMPLKEALSELETALFSTGVNPQDKMAFLPPSMDAIRNYHEYMIYFKTYDDNFWDSSLHGNIKKQMNIAKPFIRKAHELFPYELWSVYWYAKMYMKANNHKKSYEYLQIILNNSLVYSMQIYPEILEMALKCAEELNLYENANEYRRQKSALNNEYSIDVNLFSLILD